MPTEKSRTVTTEMQPDGTLVCVEGEFVETPAYDPRRTCTPEDDPRRGRVLTASICDRRWPCGKADCVKCFPGKILPPEKRGSKKPGGNQKALVRARERAKVLGYRVCLCDEDQPGVYTIDPQNGEAFSTPDGARDRARKLAKEKGESVYVFHDGQIRWIRRPNGEEEFQAPP